MQPQRKREHHHDNRFGQLRQHGVTLSFQNESSTSVCVTPWLGSSLPKMFRRKMSCAQPIEWLTATNLRLQRTPRGFGLVAKSALAGLLVLLLLLSSTLAVSSAHRQ